MSTRGSKLIIGEGAYIDSFVKIKFVGGDGDITIGKGVYINASCVLYSGNGISIGDNTLIAAGTVLAPTNHAYNDKKKLIREQKFMNSKGGIIIESDCWIGANCVILDGTHIERGCVIGAGSIVRDKIPQYTVVAGNPIKIIGSRR